MEAQGTSSEPLGVAPEAGADAIDEEHPGFVTRGRMRRRLRFLRKARELGYRDLGGLVFEMQRMGERHDELVAAKLALLGAVDTELRALETALADRRPVTVLREAGLAACPRCAAIHGSEDRFCPACGLAMNRHADRPIGMAPAAAPSASAAAQAPAATAAQAPTAAAQAPAATAPPAPAAAQAPASPATAQPGPPAAPASTPAPWQTPPTPKATPATPTRSATPATPTRNATPATPEPPATPASAPAPGRPTPSAPPAGPAPATKADDRPTEILRPGEGKG